MERWPPGAWQPWCEGALPSLRALRARGAPTSTHNGCSSTRSPLCGVVEATNLLPCDPSGFSAQCLPLPLMPAMIPESRARLAEATDRSCGGCPGAVREPQAASFRAAPAAGGVSMEGDARAVVCLRNQPGSTGKQLQPHVSPTFLFFLGLNLTLGPLRGGTEPLQGLWPLLEGAGRKIPREQAEMGSSSSAAGAGHGSTSSFPSLPAAPSTCHVPPVQDARPASGFGGFPAGLLFPSRVPVLLR